MNLINLHNGADEIWPDWHDVGRCVRVLFGKREISGLYEMDSVFESESLRFVEDATGVQHNMDDADSWEFIDDNSNCKFASGGACCVSWCGDRVCLKEKQRG